LAYSEYSIFTQLHTDGYFLNSLEKNMKTTWNDLLNSDAPILLDGAMGTMLFEQGLARGHSPEAWNVEEPDKVRYVHRAYIEAGSQVILTNTFGGNRVRLGMHKLEARVAELNEAAARLARAEADAAENPVAVAGSMGPTGSMMMPYGDMEYSTAVEIFEEQARGLLAGGVDVFWIETMADLEEVKAAVEGCRKVAPEMPIVTTLTFDTHGRTMMGIKPEQALETLRELNVMALGGNCGNGIDEIEAVVEKMHGVDENAVLVAKANVGVPRLVDDVAVYDSPPEVMGEYAIKVKGLGAKLIGACCGSTPEHIRIMADALKQA
jgi:methionine synthase I (cobalamin-dependent)